MRRIARACLRAYGRHVCRRAVLFLAAEDVGEERGSCGVIREDSYTHRPCHAAAIAFWLLSRVSTTSLKISSRISDGFVSGSFGVTEGSYRDAPEEIPPFVRLCYSWSRQARRSSNLEK